MQDTSIDPVDRRAGSAATSGAATSGATAPVGTVADEATAGDVAARTTTVGPGRVARAVIGLLLGAAAGALVALLTPRPDRVEAA